MDKIKVVLVPAVTIKDGKAEAVVMPGGYALRDVESGYYRTIHHIGEFGRAPCAWSRKRSGARRYETDAEAQRAANNYPAESDAASKRWAEKNAK